MGHARANGRIGRGARLAGGLRFHGKEKHVRRHVVAGAASGGVAIRMLTTNAVLE